MSPEECPEDIIETLAYNYTSYYSEFYIGPITSVPLFHKQFTSQSQLEASMLVVYFISSMKWFKPTVMLLAI